MNDVCSFTAFLSVTKLKLHTQNISYGLSRFFLGGGGDMGVGVQGEACRKVAKHARDGLDVYAVLQCDGCEGVAEVVESDLWDTGSGEDSL